MQIRKMSPIQHLYNVVLCHMGLIRQLDMNRFTCLFTCFEGALALWIIHGNGVFVMFSF